MTAPRTCRRVSTADAEAALAAAITAATSGGLIVIPTDTVYGVGADAFDPQAVRRLLAAKGRGPEMPPPVLVSAASTLDALAVGVPPYARALIYELWPGPLTLVCRQQPSLQWDLGDTRGTVAIRISVSNWATTEDDGERTLDAIGRCLAGARAARGG